MYKKTIELIKPIIYPEGINPQEDGQFQLGLDNRLYRSLIRLFEAFWFYNKKELYLVGGCVRDMLLGKTPKDYDLTTNATPDEVKAICENLKLKTFDSGIKHGTLTVIDDFYNQSYEITTYRIDGKYTDGRHPDSVKFVKSLEEDLKRRDFTVNSFAYNLLAHEVLALDETCFNDLKFGIIRAVGDAAERYEEDALRMLRALRFSAQLNFSIEKYTYLAIKMCAPLLAKVSKERIRDELTKIIMSDRPQVLELISITKLEDYIGDFEHPYLAYMLDCEHQNPWHYTDVFHHTMDVIKHVPKVFELRWAALFHDIGKPYVKELKEGTINHYRYLGHQEKSAEITLIIMDTLKFSNDQRDLIYKYVKYHDLDLSDCKNGTFKKIVAEIGIDHFLDFMKLRVADASAHKLSKDTKWLIDAPTKVYERFAKVIAEHQALTVRDLNINGYDLMDLGLQGKEIGQCLDYLVEEVLEDASKNTNDTLINLAKDWRDNNER